MSDSCQATHFGVCLRNPSRFPTVDVYVGNPRLRLLGKRKLPRCFFDAWGKVTMTTPVGSPPSARASSLILLYSSMGNRDHVL